MKEHILKPLDFLKDLDIPKLNNPLEPYIIKAIGCQRKQCISNTSFSFAITLSKNYNVDLLEL